MYTMSLPTAPMPYANFSKPVNRLRSPMSSVPLLLKLHGKFNHFVRTVVEPCLFVVDYILTHTAPADTVEYLSHLRLGIKNNVLEEYPLTGFLNGIQHTVQYEKWYFGHFHVDRELWRNQYALLDAIRELHTGELVKMRV